MFPLIDNGETPPSLVFTKAELLYFIHFILPSSDAKEYNSKIDMVEVKHYLNQLKDPIALALSDGSLERAVSHSSPPPDKSTPKHQEAPKTPSIADLKAQFPNLSEEEIKDILHTERPAQEHSRNQPSNTPPPPPPPSFAPKPIAPIKLPHSEPRAPINPQQERDRENSVQFASMLGAF